MYKIFFIYFLSLCLVHAQETPKGKFINSYDIHEADYFFRRNIWLKNKNWSLCVNKNDREYFDSKKKAKKAKIIMIPVFRPLGTKLDTNTLEKFNTRNLVADDEYYVALIYKNKSMVSWVFCYPSKRRKRFTMEANNYADRLTSHPLVKKLKENTIHMYYDVVAHSFCYVEGEQVWAFYSSDKKWIKFDEFLDKWMNGVSNYKKAALEYEKSKEN